MNKKLTNFFQQYRSKILTSTVIIYTLFMQSAYNACGRIGTPGVSTTASAVMLSGSCANSLMNTFSSTWHPFLVTYCNSCHSAGHGSTNLSVSFNSFMAIGEPLIESQAVTPHGGNSNSQAMASIFDQFTPGFDGALLRYQSCVAQSSPSSSSGGGSGGSGSGNSTSPILITTSQKPPANINSNNMVTMTWDLKSQSAPSSTVTYSVPVSFSIQVQYYMNQGSIVGLLFANPTVRLDSGVTTPVQIGNLHLLLDGNLQSTATDYMNTLVTVSNTNAMALAPNYSDMLVVYSGTSANTGIAFEFQNVSIPSGTGATSTVVHYSDLVATGGVFNSYCINCHSGTNAPAGVDLTKYTIAHSFANSILQHTSGASSPLMPPSGALSTAAQQTISNWVSNGALQ